MRPQNHDFLASRATAAIKFGHFQERFEWLKNNRIKNVESLEVGPIKKPTHEDMKTSKTLTPEDVEARKVLMRSEFEPRKDIDKSNFYIIKEDGSARLAQAYHGLR